MQRRVFCYPDTATTRAGIGAATAKLMTERVAIIGLGGTGSYILDLLAKVPIGEIHLFDPDIVYCITPIGLLAPPRRKISTDSTK